MSYLRPWNEALPDGTEQSNTIATLIRNKMIDVRERLADILGISDFTADPLLPTLIKLTGSTIAKIIPGSASLQMRDHADANTNLQVDDNGDVTVRGKFKSMQVDSNAAFLAGHSVLIQSPIQVSGAQAYCSRAGAGIMSGAISVNWANANNQPWTLSGNSTVSFANGQAGGWYMLEVKQGGSYAITWDAAIKWPGGVSPTQSGSGQTDFYSFYYNGSFYAGFVVGSNYSV